MTIHLHTAILGVITIGTGWLMALAGIQKNALEWRRRRRICPSCGRHIAAGACRCRSV